MSITNSLPQSTSQFVQQFWETNTECYVDRHKLKPENLCSVIVYLSEVRSYIKFLFHLECHISLYKLFKCNFLNAQCSPSLLLNNYCTNAHWSFNSCHRLKDFVHCCHGGGKTVQVPKNPRLEKNNSISTSSHVLFCLSYKHVQ